MGMQNGGNASTTNTVSGTLYQQLLQALMPQEPIPNPAYPGGYELEDGFKRKMRPMSPFNHQWNLVSQPQVAQQQVIYGGPLASHGSGASITLVQQIGGLGPQWHYNGSPQPLTAIQQQPVQQVLQTGAISSSGLLNALLSPKLVQPKPLSYVSATDAKPTGSSGDSNG